MGSRTSCLTAAPRSSPRGSETSSRSAPHDAWLPSTPAVECSYLSKRALDLLVVLIGLPIAVPVGILVALLIKAVSPGPVFFAQDRVGRHGRRFRCVKFRTMAVNADQGLHRLHSANFVSGDLAMTKLDMADPRVIPFGLVIRALGIDEIPQLWNVFRGDMSIVGPRPCTPYEYERYLPWQLERFHAAPGVTGLWQVSGKNRLTFTEMVRLDIDYTRKVSLAMDLMIIARTPAVIVAAAFDLAGRVRARSGAPNDLEIPVGTVCEASAGSETRSA
jgi:exopolysaccharide production protein ExoY